MHKPFDIPQTFGDPIPRIRWNARYNEDLARLRTAGDRGINELALSRSGFAPDTLRSYVDRHQVEPSWITSRLQMYWHSRATTVWVDGPRFCRSGGPPAPVPTVRFPGARDKATIYATPSIDKIIPFSDESCGVYVWNSAAGQMEWAEASRTGRVVQEINEGIMRMAELSGMLFQLTSEARFAQFAWDILDCYVSGIFYAREPIDITEGHQQTIVGLTSFEVIHEQIIVTITRTLGYISDYVDAKSDGKRSFYSVALKRWMDIIIKNGVPFNNWNYYTARFVLECASVLDGDDQFGDKRGNRWYVNRILNDTSSRQWSFRDMLDRGFDHQSATWKEAPSYAIAMVSNLAETAEFLQSMYGIDIIIAAPVIHRAILTMPQYLFPNGIPTAFGDSVYSPIPLFGMRGFASYAARSGNAILAAEMRALLRELEALSRPLPQEERLRLLEASPPDARQRPSPSTYIHTKYQTPVFYSEGASFLVQRSSTKHGQGLMVVQYASKGNHMHANGVGMELFGRDIVLGVCSGIGQSYFQPDYAEYYSQFPAHNTVVVDGMSAYPAMRSNHAFQLQSCYPLPGTRSGYFEGVTYSDVYFREPETNSDQTRLMGIVRIDDKSGYYVDIFRSRRRDGMDVKHEYFYQNLGQSVVLTDASMQPIDLSETEDLSFAEGDLFAYDYLSEKRRTNYEGDVEAVFTLSSENVVRKMHVWIKGSEQRSIYTAKGPRSFALDGHKFTSAKMVPPSIAALKIPKLVLRQTGEAWTRPFVCIYEASMGAGRSIENISAVDLKGASAGFVALKVRTSIGTVQHIFSSSEDDDGMFTSENMQFRGTYGVIESGPAGIRYLFLGSGRRIAADGYGLSMTVETNGSGVVAKGPDGWYYSSDHACVIVVPDNAFPKGRSPTIAGTFEDRSRTAWVTEGGIRKIKIELPPSSYALFLRNV